MVAVGLSGTGARALVLALLVGLPLGTAQAPADGAGAQYVVAFSQVPPTLAIGDAFAGAEVVAMADSLGFILVQPGDPAAFMAQVLRHPEVRYVEENRVAVRTMLAPDDPRFDDQYGPQQIRAPEAWDTRLGGDERTVCIVDSGIRYTHEDLAGSRWLGGWDFVHRTDDPWDDNGHGTHVAGTAAAGVDNGVGIAGVGNVGFLAVKALDSRGSGSFFDVASAIAWCADNGGDVISMSLGSPWFSWTLFDAVQYAWGQGALLVGAAGNNGPCNNCIGYPAALDEVIAVTCTTATEAQCGFSSDGPESELAAPGQSILSTYVGSDSDYAAKSGTSMSTPHVAGVAALIWNHAPDLTNQQLRDVLQNSARDAGPTGWDEQYGYGIVDAAEAIASLRPPSPPRNLVATPEDGAILLTWDEPADPGGLGVDIYYVYRGADEATMTRVAETTLLSYRDSGLGEGATFTYAVSAASGMGESDRSASVTATSLMGPAAAFAWTPELPEPGQEVQFQDQSTDSDGSVAAWSWDFGDGEGSDQRHPSHTFSSDGTFTVRLTVTDSDGLEDTASADILVNAAPTASFDHTPEAPDTQDEIQFTDTSTDADGSVQAWHWDLGDGTISSDQNPTHRFPDNGDYVVTLTVTDDDGANDTTSRTVAVSNVAPAASFTYAPSAPTTADTVAFTDGSSDVDGTVVAWSWDFGDGATSSEQHPSHRYADDGTYTVTLTVSDDDGADNTTVQAITVTNLAPTAAFAYSPASPSTADDVAFTDESLDADGTVASWAWDFGDGATSSEQHPSHSYADDGSYTVTLSVTDDDGATAEASQTVSVTNVAPVAGFTTSPEDPTTQVDIDFTDTSTDSDGSVVDWNWDFGDGANSTEANPSHRYADDGTYTVTLTVTDDDGATDATSQTVTVANVAPTVDFSYSPAEPTTQDEVQFTDASGDLDGTVVAWNWDFGDGSASDDQNPTHRFPDDGVYAVTLSVTDDDGATAATTIDVTVTNVAPEASFSHDPIEPRTTDTVTFADASSDIDGTVVAWNWDFGDGESSDDQNPTHQYAAVGTYTVSLTVTDNDGATGLVSVDITVVDPPSAPRDISARPGPGLGDIDVRWTRPASDGGAPLLGNLIYRSDGGDFELIADIGNYRRYVDDDRKLGTIYTYYVVPYNRAGEGPASDTASAAGTGL